MKITSIKTIYVILYTILIISIISVIIYYVLKSSKNKNKSKQNIEKLYDINEYSNSIFIPTNTSSINKRSKCYDCEIDIKDESKKWLTQKSSCYTCERQLTSNNDCTKGYYASGSISTV